MVLVVVHVVVVVVVDGTDHCCTALADTVDCCVVALRVAIALPAHDHYGTRHVASQKRNTELYQKDLHTYDVVRSA
jgi:hypothetical protein